MNAYRLFAIIAFLLAGLGIYLYRIFGFIPSVIYAEIIIGIIALLLYFIYRRLILPIKAAERGMDLLREQDYSSRLARVGQKDTDKIVDLFNALMDRLKTEKLHVREQNGFLDLLIEASPLGIISLGNDESIVMRNNTACRFLEEDPAGKHLENLSSPIARTCMQLKRGDSATLRLSDTKIYRCTRLSFMDRGMARPFILIESLTEEVRKAERDAYGKVIRVIGHEVNNSMASIRSLIDLLLDVKPWGDNQDLTLAAEGCAHRAESLSKFISAYAAVVKIPEPRPLPLSLGSFIREMQPFLTSMAAKHDIPISFIYPNTEMSEVMIDAPLMEQVMINIVKNSIESICDDSDRDGKIEISVGHDNTLTITDTGAGISDDTAGKIFSPFFSTKESGQGLGLMFVAEILRRHSATFSLSTDKEGYTRFRIRLP